MVFTITVQRYVTLIEAALHHTSQHNRYTYYADVRGANLQNTSQTLYEKERL